jgi:hypothetical protein
MTVRDHHPRVLTGTSIREYFCNSIDSAMSNRRVSAGPETVYYVVDLLTSFARTERLFERTADGLDFKPLAMIYADAVQSCTNNERCESLRRLGDVALFVAGVFADSLRRKVVDVHYYIAMGGAAYGSLSEELRGTARGQALGPVYEELSQKFHDFVEVLGEVSDSSGAAEDRDILRLYELWLRTGSRSAASRLRAMGVEPNGSIASARCH